MEPTIAGALYTAETLLEGAVAFAKGIAHPTLPLKANLAHITSTPLARSHHTLSVVKGRAYIFGGRAAPGTLADNDMHIVILPSSGVLEADYTSIKARSTQSGGEVPSPRKGHTAVVVGDSIYVFGGKTQDNTDEKGRIWVFSTISNSWSHIDPAPDSQYPDHRWHHSAASSELPGPRDEVMYREKAPQQPADPAKVVPEPAESDTWGTIFIVGGTLLSSSQPSNDAFAFDVRTRTWSTIPSPSEPVKQGASLVLVDDRLYRFAGQTPDGIYHNAIEYLDVSPVWKHAEGGTTPLTSGWAWEEIFSSPSPSSEPLPQSRSGTGLTSVTTGQGRHYLLALGGEAQAGVVLEDVWAFQLPSEKATAAAAKDSSRASVKAATYEGKWAESVCKHVDTKGEVEKGRVEAQRGFGARKDFAIAKGSEVDGATAVVWGGVDGSGNVLDDGWLVTVER
ncbi:hypothetical protein BDV96DRAFT_55841 [Lophiotrema nucula]|uniref:Galactose oxidase n=1 Tax=Lophiotrema nucula TaxID=690887 RepID=A0A6A5ZA22_9PLEO|nr:hypothetical protein BDV96DRAFT_55841 [Lophiotrema nucula]